MEAKKVLKEIYVGIVVVEIAFLILGIFLMRPYYLFVVGIGIGMLGAFFEVYHMYDCLNKALNMPPKNARSYVTSRSFVRLVASAALMLIGIYIHWVTFVGITISLIAIKIAALINPLIRKVKKTD